jgi:Ca2+:H+ antiporter
MAMVDALSSLMIITATALILPTALYSTLSTSESAQLEGKIISFSRGSALVLLGLYAIYLYFQLKTHNYFFLGDSNDGSVTPSQERNGENEEPKLSSSTATIVLLAATVGIMGCTHLLIDSIDETAKFAHITKTFIGAILIPIASNAPECMTIMVQARNGRVDFAIGVIVSSILQIALFVIPFLVILGWFIQQPMTLNFETFQTTMLFLAVLVVNRLLQDGKYTYIQGAMLVAL